MDVVLEVADTFLFDYMYAWALPARPAPYDYPNRARSNETSQSAWHYEPATTLLYLEPSKAAYSSSWARDNIFRQSCSLFFILWIFGLIMYYVFATLSYIFVFDKKTMDHPKFLKNQVKMEMIQANKAFPIMAIYTFPLMVAEVRGHSKLYDLTSDGPGRWYDVLQFPLFLLFTDFFIYWIHRGLHHPLFYKSLHKPHHKWIMPTPFASHAFHPLDGFAQSFPYHIFPFIFPLQKWAYVVLFVFINFWTILIHDGEYVSINPVINGAANHSLHHYAFNYNYGQYFTLWDRVGGSYRCPDKELLMKDSKMSTDMWARQVAEAERMVKEVEGSDDRVYEPPEEKKTQ